MGDAAKDRTIDRRKAGSSFLLRLPTRYRALLEAMRVKEYREFNNSVMRALDQMAERDGYDVPKSDAG